MKKKIIAYTTVATILGFGLLGSGAALANGWFGGSTKTPDEIATQHQTMFTEQAQLLGISVDEVKAAWAEGKTMQEIAEEKGITQEELRTRMQEARRQQMKTELQALVDKGVITQAQADQRLQFMQNMPQNGKGRMGMGKGGPRGEMHF